MLVNCFFYIGVFSVISFVVCILGVIISYIFQSPDMAKNLFHSYIFNFNGILIFGFGYSLMWYIKNVGKSFLSMINEIIEIPEEILPKVVYYHRAATSLIRSNVISIPLTIIGGAILWNCGYPLDGFAKYHLAICSISLYYVAGYSLSFFVYSILIFKLFDRTNIQVTMKKNAPLLTVDTFNSFVIISSTLAVIALYLAFRGTLTANFINPSTSIAGKMLIFPMMIFLPVVLFASFYPRFMLKKIYENGIIKRISELEKNRYAISDEDVSIKEKLEMEKILLEIKERLLLEKNKFSVLSIKDSPSLVITMLMVIQFLFQNDTIVKKFLNSVFGI